MDELDSVKLELEAERHNHRKDVQTLLERAGRAEERIRKAAALFGVPDGGQYWNDWLERADKLGVK